MGWRDNLRNPKNLGVIKGPHGHASQPHLSVHAKGGRIGKFGGGRTNLLEELGRVEAERSNPNRRAEISRVHGELNRGYKTGGRVKKAVGGWTLKRPVQKLLEGIGGGSEKKPHSTRAGRISAGARKIKRGAKKVAEPFVKEAITWEKLRKNKAEGGRVGLKHGGKPWGTGPKPGTHEFLEHHLHKPRKGKAFGGPLRVGKQLAKNFKKKKVYPETEDLTHQKGPYVGDVGSEGKKGKRPPAKTRSPERSQDPKRGRRPWRDAIPGRPRPGTPAPNWIKPKKYQPAAEGGRIGLKKGGSDKNWIQKATASIKKRGTKGKCTPITKPGCTGRAKALAKTFKKMAKKRKTA